MGRKQEVRQSAQKWRSGRIRPACPQAMPVVLVHRSPGFHGCPAVMERLADQNATSPPDARTGLRDRRDDQFGKTIAPNWCEYRASALYWCLAQVSRWGATVGTARPVRRENAAPRCFAGASFQSPVASSPGAISGSGAIGSPGADSVSSTGEASSIGGRISICSA